jgi:polyisoprenoid-binding protein YceI
MPEGYAMTGISSKDETCALAGSSDLAQAQPVQANHQSGGSVMTTSAQPALAELQAQLADGSLAGSWTLDSERSTVTLRSKSMWGLIPVKGVFRELEGAATISPAGEITGRLTVAAGSVDTSNSKRDEHLRSDDFFLSEKHPAITFTLSALTLADEGASVSGTLTVREKSQAITFPASVGRLDDGALALDATLQVDRSEFGLTWNQMGMASMKNAITIHAVFTKS